MAKPRKGKLKLFRTEIGFHDAYVAAPSMKAALEAWGASTDLFSAGLAERIDDPDACAAAFDKPGETITAKRGTKAEWTARAKPKPKKASKQEAARARLEARLAKLEERHSKALAELDREAEALRKKRDKLLGKQEAERSKIQAELELLGG